MRLWTDTPRADFGKEMYDVTGIFYPDVDLAQGPDDADLSLVHLEEERGSLRTTSLKLSGLLQAEAVYTEPVLPDPVRDKRLCKRRLKLALYQLLKDVKGMQPPWGALTGIRPTRLVYEKMAEGMDLEEALAHVGEEYDVTPQKTSLLGMAVKAQQSLEKAGDDEVDLYIGIPFCESRCRYCSFISAQVGNGQLLDPYTRALEGEIAAVIRLIREKKLRPRAFYMGGGTPTALNPMQLDRVLQAAKPLIDACRESTVEAGRPDSMTRERLEVLKRHGISRISVNPQTVHDVTLELIGRRHTHAQTEEAFGLARSMGFDHINMDLIAGLPGETPDMFRLTLDWVKRSSPESLTVHTLCVKRSSDMHRWQDSLPPGEAVEEMVRMGLDAALSLGMKPYYLYRQKHMAGNLENVGYARPGMECLYNVDTMEDTLSVLAMGAGGISKRVTPGRVMVYRAANVKEISQYIGRVDEMAQRKRDLWSDI